MNLTRKRPFISIPEFARMGGLNYKLARRLVLDGTVPSKLIGCQRRIRTEWAERWLSESDAPNLRPAATESNLISARGALE
jgi:hypothetical protein